MKSYTRHLSMSFIQSSAWVLLSELLTHLSDQEEHSQRDSISIASPFSCSEF